MTKRLNLSGRWQLPLSSGRSLPAPPRHRALLPASCFVVEPAGGGPSSVPSNASSPAPLLSSRRLFSYRKGTSVPSQHGASAGPVVRLAGMGAPEALGTARGGFTGYELGPPERSPWWPSLCGAAQAAGEGRGFGQCSHLLPGLPLPRPLCPWNGPHAPAGVSSQFSRTS